MLQYLLNSKVLTFLTPSIYLKYQNDSDWKQTFRFTVIVLNQLLPMAFQHREVPAFSISKDKNKA